MTSILDNMTSFLSLRFCRLLIICAISFCNCQNKSSIPHSTFPSDVFPLHQWSILTGKGQSIKDLTKFQDSLYFYSIQEKGTDWLVFKSPNSGVTSKNSNNTRTELSQHRRWTPEQGGSLKGTLKVKHVSTSGDARAAASFSVVIGQIHSDEGHENEPLKIFYKKFPGHEKGSVFWNYEINTEGDNSKRWDYSTAVWGYDMSVIGNSPNSCPEEPKDGVALNEEFSYEINVYKGVMYLTFLRENHPPKYFIKDLTQSIYQSKTNIPQQVQNLYSTLNRDGVERPEAYKDELQFFKLGAYNQSNGKSPQGNMVWNTGAETFSNDVHEQYKHGAYTEVWFKNSFLGSGIPVTKD